jgi:hypothetical protein
MPDLLRELVGVFGWSEVRLPTAGYIAWGVAVLVVVAVAVVVGTWSERIGTMSAVVGSMAALIGVTALLQIQPGFGEGGQGRYVLALVVSVPLIAGEVASRHAARLAPAAQELLLGGAGVTVAGIQATAWFASARRFAVGIDGPLWFPSSARWSPPLGWTLWIAVAAVGTLLVWTAAAIGVQAVRSDRSWFDV